MVEVNNVKEAFLFAFTKRLRFQWKPPRCVMLATRVCVHFISRLCRTKLRICETHTILKIMLNKNIFAFYSGRWIVLAFKVFVAISTYRHNFSKKAVYLKSGIVFASAKMLSPPALSRSKPQVHRSIQSSKLHVIHCVPTDDILIC